MNWKMENKQRILDIYGHEPTDLNDLARCTMAVINHNLAGQSRLLGFSWRLNFQEVSNSHYCPIDGVTNWGGRTPGAPRSYAGWYGRVWVRYENSPKSFGSDPLRGTLTHTGTGGFGSYNGPWHDISHAIHNTYSTKNRKGKGKSKEPQLYSWDYRVFDADWPLISDEFQQLRIADILSGDFKTHSHSFLWEDPLTKIIDHQEIIARRQTQIDADRRRKEESSW